MGSPLRSTDEGREGAYYLPQEFSTVTTETTIPVIFLAFANDRDDRVDSRYLRNLPEEARRLQKTLESAQRDGL
jgi:hypothetical protein